MTVVTDPIRRVSPTFPRITLDRILKEAKPFTETGHFLYPADENGNHTKGFFAFEPVARAPKFVDAIADDGAKRGTGSATVSTARFRWMYPSFLLPTVPFAPPWGRLRARGASSRRPRDEARTLLGGRLEPATRRRHRPLGSLGVGRRPRRGGSGDSLRDRGVHRRLPGAQRRHVGADPPSPFRSRTNRD